MEMLLKTKEKQEKELSKRAGKVTGKVIRTNDEGMAILFNRDYEIFPLVAQLGNKQTNCSVAPQRHFYFFFLIKHKR